MSLINPIRNILKKLEKLFLVVLLGVLVLFSFVQVALRLFFSYGLPWADIFLRHIVLWIGFIAGALALEDGKHFAIDLLKKKFAGKTLFAVNLLIDIFALVTLYYLWDAGMGFWRDDFLNKSSLFMVGFYEVYSYILNGIIPAGFFLLLIHASFKTIEDLNFLLESKS